MKQWVMLGAVLALAGCGGGDGYRGNSGAIPMASGPINSACMQSDRKARSRALCGCIQAVANDTLSSAQQRRAVRFYRDPQAAQDIRQSKRPGDERFWDAYSAYAQRAEQVCR
ncbi:hypothetical protein [uncultured Roseovarius sp.]|uniref:hypothetical protein n=1 Tax=uncultured Roseovarius sp. TaxID=293344 RepID=UPI0030D7BC73|tara:strand:- start:1762 stop:2100 length:339 start_codon:yes stop_codon:yes gene_type:complete